MTGRIKSFSAAKGSGLIETADGDAALFEISDVLAFDRSGLKPGKIVSFLFADTSSPKRAYEIFVCTGINDSHDPAKPKYCDDLRFKGFRYEEGSRVYCFEETVIGEETRQFRVSTDVSMLLAHKISLQEAPSLCLALLQLKLRSHEIPQESRRFQCKLTEREVLTFVASRIEGKPRVFRKPGRALRRQDPPETDHHRSSASPAGQPLPPSGANNNGQGALASGRQPH